MLLNETVCEFSVFHLANINEELSFGHNNGTRKIQKLQFSKLIISQIWRELVIDSGISLVV